MEWITFDNGASIDQRGSEGGIIIRDDEHPLGARCTLEQGGDIAPFSITCGIYGWMFHTRFFSSQSEAEAEFDSMKVVLADILNIIPLETDPEVDTKVVRVMDAITEFVERYP